MGAAICSQHLWVSALWCIFEPVLGILLKKPAGLAAAGFVHVGDPCSRELSCCLFKHS